MTEPPQLCRRCGRVVGVEADRYDVFEQMHYVCFHYDFEHDPVDPDEECSAGGCPSAAIRPRPERRPANRLQRSNAMDVSSLVGSFVVEVGVRQAWPFLTFCDNRSTPSIERRLYIESGLEVRPALPITGGDMLSTQVSALYALNGRAVTAIDVGADGTLSASLGDALLVVDGDAGPETSIEPWWLSPQPFNRPGGA